MDVAGTFFPNLTTILLALQDKSVSFHFANIFDLDKLDFFEFISVICRHRRAESLLFKHEKSSRQQTQWGR